MKKVALYIAIIPLFLALTACKSNEVGKSTLYDSKALRIEREGDTTHIYDVEGGGSYSFKTVSTRKKKSEVQAVKTASTSVSSETIDIKTVHGLIIVTLKPDGETLYIK